MDDRGQRSDRGLSRRELIKRTLKTSAYAAPVVLSATVPALSVSAVTPIAGTPIQDALLHDVGHNACFDVFFSLDGSPSSFLGKILSDAFGIAGGAFSFPAGTNLRGVSTVTLTYFFDLNGCNTSVPQPAQNPAAPPFNSGVVGLMNGNTTQLLANVLQAPVGCTTPTQYSEYFDVVIVNGRPNTQYVITAQSSTFSVTLAPPLTTSPQGHVAGYFPAAAVSLSATAPTSVVVTATPVGGGTALSVTVPDASGNSPLTTLTCAQVAGTAGRAIGVAPR